MVQFTGIEGILHPISVHFPIALTITGFVIALIYLIWKKDIYLNWGIKIILWLATLGAIGAFITSNFTPHLTGEANNVENMHHIYAVITLICLCIASVFYFIMSVYKPRVNILGWVGFIFYFLSALFVGITGYYGGYIIYNVLL